MAGQAVDISGDGVVARSAGHGITHAVGSGAPTASAVGFAKGGQYTDMTNGVVYVNSGTSASATWVADAVGSSISVDTITESTAGAGVTIDGVLVKDTGISNADLTLNSTNEINVTISNLAFIAIDDAAISGHAAAASTAGKSAFLKVPDAGTNAAGDGDAGGNWTFTAGDGSVGEAGNAGGDGGTITLTGGVGGDDGGDGSGGAGGSIYLIPGAGGTTSGGTDGSAGRVVVPDDRSLTLGTGLDTSLRWSTADADNHAAVLAVGQSNQVLHVCESDDIALDWAVGANAADAEIRIHSSTMPATDYMLIGNHDGTVAAVDVVGGTTLDLRIAGTDIVQLTATALTLAAGTTSIAGAGSTVAPLMPIAAQQALAAAGDVNVTTFYTSIVSDGDAEAYTLANGAQIGQLKKIKFITDGGGDAVLTPTSLAGGDTITFADVGDYALLMWNGTDWVAIELGNDADGSTAPVIA